MIHDPFSIWIILLLPGPYALNTPDTPIGRIVLRNICETKQLLDSDSAFAEEWLYQKYYLINWYGIIDDFPIIEDAKMLPPPYVSKPLLDFAEQHVKYLESCVLYDKTLEPWLHDAQKLRDIWKSIYKAHPNSPSYQYRNLNIGKTFSRRMHLEYIRNKIGYQDYYECYWPPPVPLGYFRKAN